MKAHPAGFIVAFASVLAMTSADAAEMSLLDAAESGDRAAALHLLAEGSDARERGPDGTTALMWAAYYDDVELVRRLIEAGADVSAQNDFGTSALAEASIIGSA